MAQNIKAQETSGFNPSQVLSNLKIRNGSSWSMLVFGVLAAVLGVIGLIYPDAMLIQMGFPTVPLSDRLSHDFTMVFIRTSSMASLNMGVYYIFAAFQNLKAFYRWTVPFRVLTFTVFTSVVVSHAAPVGLMAVAIWELSGALITGWFLHLEKRKGIE